MDGGNEIMSGPRLVEGGEWAGWRTWSGLDPFEDQSGPFYFREDDAGVVTTAFRAETKHMNGGGFMHGGCMMTFADFSLFAIAWKELADSRAVTVSLNGEFVGPARPGDLVTATGEVVRAGGSLLFIRGLIATGGSPMLNFSGVVKKIRSRG
ncbi:PaaI family thioesterase [Caulobacter sp.]|uniref:hotdog domain-containing protein n=1 Tax=Caulobacter sp. TaxID=78 RepID=UPI001618A3FC